MKQILMSKEEYDQLMLDMDNLKKEKEQLNEHNAELNKEIVSLNEKIEELEQYIKSGHASNDMYLNQITTRYKSLDIDLVIDKLKREAETYLKKAENTIGGGVIITTPVMRFFDSLKETCIFDYCMKTETEETEYGFCITEQLLYGTLLEARLSEISKLNWEIYQLKEKIDKISAERDNALRKYDKMSSEYRRKESDMIHLRQSYQTFRQEFAETIKEKEKYFELNKSLSQQVQSLAKDIKNYERNYIKMPKWLFPFWKLLKRDKENE